MEPKKVQAFKYPEIASILRGMLKFKKELLELDPWLPFPQNTCCYSFGADGRPLPIGALFILWEKWPECTKPCSACGGASFGFGWGGFFSMGGVVGYCSVCGSAFSKPIGGLSQTCAQFGPLLRDTPYFVKQSMWGGTYEGPRPPLVNALRQLGATDLPGDEWTQASEPCRVSYTIDLSKNESDWNGPFNWEAAFHRMLWVIGVGLVMAALRHVGPFLAQLK